MSNYTWMPMPPELTRLQDEIVIGPETVNGTGEVALKAFDSNDDGAYFILTAAETRALARLFNEAADIAEQRESEL